jgi:hypothetical protein
MWRDQYTVETAVLERAATGLRATLDVPETAADADIAR